MFAEISAFSHSTEDEVKVQRAVLNTLPQELWNVVRFSSQTVKGHYNDRITVLKVKLGGEGQRLAYHLLGHFSPLDRRKFLEELSDMVDSSGNLYLRLNKQEAFLGNIELGGSDLIRIKLKFKSSGKSVSIFSIREALSTILREAQETRRYEGLWN